MPLSTFDFKSNIIGKMIREKVFEVEEDNKRDHIYYKILYNKKPILMTKCSHGSGGKEIDDNILLKIKNQLRFNSKPQLMEFEKCNISSEAYLNLLKQKNVISD